MKEDRTKICEDTNTWQRNWNEKIHENFEVNLWINEEGILNERIVRLWKKNGAFHVRNERRLKHGEKKLLCKDLMKTWGKYKDTEEKSWLAKGL